MAVARLRELGFVLFLHDPKPGLGLGAWRQEPKLAQDINHGALNTGLRADIFHAPPKQKFRDFLLSTARLIGTLATRMRTEFRTTAPRWRLKPLFAPITFRHAFRHVTKILTPSPGNKSIKLALPIRLGQTHRRRG